MGKYTEQVLASILKDPVQFQEKLCNRECVSETQKRILRSDAPRICISAGRRWSKTTMLAAYSLWYAINYPKAEIGIISSSWEQVEIFMDMIRELIDEFPTDLKNRLRITENKKYKMTIEGSKFVGMSATKNATGMRGHGFDLIIRDEDAFIPDESMKAIRPLRIRYGKKKKMCKEFAASTPLGHNHFWKDFNSKHYESYKVPTWDNKFISKEEIEMDKELLTLSEFNQEYGADFMDDEHSVFAQSLIDKATDHNLKLRDDPDPKNNWSYVVGIDLGKKRDASVIYIIHQEDNHIYVDHIREFKNDMSGKFWTKILNESIRLIQHFGVTHGFVDQTGIGDMPVEELRDMLMKKGIASNVLGIDFTRRLKNSKHGLINNLLLKFERGEIHFPFNTKLIRELKNIRYEVSSSPSAKLETFGRFTHVGHDDHVIALSLAVYSLPNNREIFYTRSNEITPGNTREMPRLHVTNKGEMMSYRLT